MWFGWFGNRYWNFLLPLRNIHSRYWDSHRGQDLYVALPYCTRKMKYEEIFLCYLLGVHFTEMSRVLGVCLYVHLESSVTSVISFVEATEISLQSRAAQDSACCQLAFHSLYGGCCCYTCCTRRKVRQRFNIPVKISHTICLTRSICCTIGSVVLMRSCFPIPCSSIFDKYLWGELVQGNCCGDYWTHFCCCCCAVLQELHELRYQERQGKLICSITLLNLILEE